MRIAKIILVILLATTIFYANSQNDTTKHGPVITIINGSSFAKLHDISFRYIKENDSSWGVQLYGLKSEYMLPGDTANSGELADSLLQFYRYEYDYVVNGKTLHKSVDTNFTMKWNDSKTFILPNFYIPPPWWKTGWLYIVLFILCLGLSALLVKYFATVKLQKQKRELEKQLAVQNERMRISSDMHDDLGAGLYGIKLQTEILSNKNLEPEIQNQFMQLHKSVSEISSKVREVIWSLDTENDSLLNLISFIHQQGHRMFANSEIDLTVISPENDLSVTISGETRRNIYLVIKEALNNVLKHSGAKYAKINFTFSDHILQILIEDDGKGFNAVSSSVESMGLRTMKERIKLINGELDINVLCY